MLLLIDAELSAPPSTPLIFRDVTLYAVTLYDYEVVAISPRDMIDNYAVWFKRRGLFDYLKDIMPPSEKIRSEAKVYIEAGKSFRLTEVNYHRVLSQIKYYSKE